MSSMSNVGESMKNCFPLFDELVLKYWSQNDGWTPVAEWSSYDVARLELFAHEELQRRALISEAIYVTSGSRSIH